MSTSTKTPKSIRQGGPGAAHEDATARLQIKKPPPDSSRRKRSKAKPQEVAANTTFITPMIPQRRAEASDMTKHAKMKKPSDSDLRSNPLIGASRGATLAGASPDDLEESQGANTIEGDLENDPNAAGGIDKSESRAGARPKRR